MPHNFLVRIPPPTVYRNSDPKEEHRHLTTMQTITINPVPTPYLPSFGALKAQYAANEGTSRGSLSSHFTAGLETQRLKRIEWEELDLRQKWADEAFMRRHIKASGIKSPQCNEPATVIRLRCLLRRVGVVGLETRASLGTSLIGFLKMNPRLPLWVALALILEATGRFTPPHKPCGT